MGYELHIERDEPIQLDEWKAAVAQVEGVTLRSEDSVAVNPATGEKIRISVQDGDALISLPDAAGTAGLRWSSSGRASFRPPDDWDKPSSTVRAKVFSLAEQLEARVVGDEGEEYEPPKSTGSKKGWWKHW